MESRTSQLDITEVFCDVDDFCQIFEPLLKQVLLPEVGDQSRQKTRMILSEILTILIFTSFKIYSLYSRKFVQR